MKEDAQQLLAKKYAPAVRNRLSRFASQDQLDLASWFIHHPVGTNYAMQILESLEDLAKKKEQPVLVLWREILSKFQEDELQPKELGCQVRNHLYRMLHPESSDHLGKFLAFAKSLGLPEQTQVIPPQNFEGKNFTLKLDFKNVAQLKFQLNEILGSIREGRWQGLENF